MRSRPEARSCKAQFEALESRRMMSSELNSLSAQLDLLDARTKRQIDKLSVYAGDLETLATQNETDIEVWTRALRAARRASVPKSVRDRTASILQGLREGRKELNKKIGEVLALQSRTLDVRDAVHRGRTGRDCSRSVSKRRASSSGRIHRCGQR